MTTELLTTSITLLTESFMNSEIGLFIQQTFAEHPLFAQIIMANIVCGVARSLIKLISAPFKQLMLKLHQKDTSKPKIMDVTTKWYTHKFNPIIKK